MEYIKLNNGVEILILGFGVYQIPRETLAEIGFRYGKSAAQVILRWLIQRGVIVNCKSTHIERMFDQTAKERRKNQDSWKDKKDW